MTDLETVPGLASDSAALPDSTSRRSRGLFDQPRSVWAVAFSCVIAFMGIGLVDPILPTLRQDLGATPAQISLLFSSYMLVTGVAMLVTGWVSSRIGTKRTLVAGLALVVLCSAAAGASDSIATIVGFRAGWGLGNALFIATALAVIVGAASGGVSGAIILYEAALGVGISTGPLLGGLLGDISWRGPFFGTALLMAIGVVAVTALLPKEDTKPSRAGFWEPIKALRHPGLLTVGLVALFYNMGFFTLLAYAPYPMNMGALALGAVFFGWGLAVALTSVFAAPRLQRRFGARSTITACLVLLAADLAVMALFIDVPGVLAGAVVFAGTVLGVNNTLITMAVMQISPVPRPIASAGYSFVRFTGGALAPILATTLAEVLEPAAAFWFGTCAVLAAVLIMCLRGRHLGVLDEPEQRSTSESALESADGLQSLEV